MLPLLAAALIATSSSAEPQKTELTTSFKGQIFFRAREQKLESFDWQRQYRLARVRLSVELHYGELLGLVIEPDFANAFCSASGAVCGDELSDAYLDLRPKGPFDFRIGHAKSPFGAFESESEWRLPSQRRGLVSDVVADRFGFGGRHLGVKARARFKKVPLKPSIELGGYVDLSNSGDEDAALRLGIRPFEHAAIELAGYMRANATTANGYGIASAIDATYDDDALFVILEAQLGHARLLRKDSMSTNQDSNFLAARAIAAYALALDADHEFEVEPYGAFDFLDPNTETTDDVGLAVRAGANLHFQRRLRLGAEFEHRTSAAAFVEPESTTISIFGGVSIE